jgi:hypothetical protein
MLKGLCHEMNNFLKVLKIKSVLSVYAPIVFKNFKVLDCHSENTDCLLRHTGTHFPFNIHIYLYL